jgi:hypothetical protein
VPYVQSENPTLSRTLIAALLGTLQTDPAAPLLSTPKVKLFTAGPSPITPESVPADFTEATFAGYAEVALGTLLGPVNFSNGGGIGLHVEANFLGGAVVAPGEVILGYYVTDDADALYLAERFDTPIPIAVPGDFIALDVIFGIPFETTVD